MKVLVTSLGRELDSPFSFSFGRAPYFLIIDTEEMKIVEVIENPAVNYPRGAGIVAASIASGKAKVIITGNVGLNAYRVLTQYGCQLYSVAAKTVREAVELFKQGKAIPIVGPGGWGWRRGWRGGRGVQ